MDLYLSLHKCTPLNPRITSDGYFEAFIIDYYDFKYEEHKKNEGIGDYFFKEVNNWGLSMQQKGYAENYFIIYRIRLEL